MNDPLGLNYNKTTKMPSQNSFFADFLQVAASKDNRTMWRIPRKFLPTPL